MASYLDVQLHTSNRSLTVGCSCGVCHRHRWTNGKFHSLFSWRAYIFAGSLAFGSQHGCHMPH